MNSKIIMFLTIFFCIFFMSVGYSALNTDLTISGEVFVKGINDIKITNISINSQENGGMETYSAVYSNEETELSVSLPNQNSSITFDIEITNETGDYFYLGDVEELLNSNPNIKYEILNKELLYFNANTINTIQVKFYYINPSNENTDISLNLKYNFVASPIEKLEYITSTGTQYIDTGVMSTGDYAFESEFYIVTKAKGEGVWLFSGRQVTDHTVGLYFFISSNYNYTIRAYGGSTAAYTSPTFPKNTWYNMYFSRTTFTINSITIPVTSGTIVPESAAASILLGGNVVNWDGGVDTRQFEGDIKYFKITDVVTGNVLRHFIPARVLATDEIGYWDVIEDKFYSNAGTGEFGLVTSRKKPSKN